MRPAVTACAALATTAALWSWLRRRRRRELARRYAYELLGDPRVRRSLDPYPSSTTVAALSALTGVATAKIRKFSAGARDGACARPWHADGAPRAGGRTKRKASHYYFVLHKPLGVVTQRDDASTKTYVPRPGRNDKRWRPWRRKYVPTVYDGLPNGFPPVPSVGRLDKETSGLLLFTDDGALTTRLLRPGSGCDKTYVLDISEVPEGAAGDAALATLSEPLDDVTKHTREKVRTAPARVKVVSRSDEGARVEVVISEGRHHQVRRLAARAGFEVEALHRKAMGALCLDDLPVGEARPLTPDEVATLLRLHGLEQKRGPPRRLPVAAAPELTRAAVEAAIDDLVRRHP